MKEMFTRWPGTPPEGRSAARCVVSYPETCGETTVGEGWDLPLSERHWQEAEMAAREELARAVANELEALALAERERLDRDPAVVRALQDIPVAIGTVFGARWEREDSVRYEEAQAAAFPLDGLEGMTDPETLAFDYGRYDGDGPVEWWTDERLLLLRFMRQARGEGLSRLVVDLEKLRERATIQLALAERDFERRYAAPRRAAREAEQRAGG